jgi:hypothetical protein
MAEDRGSVLEWSGCRRPAGIEATLEQFVGRRLVVPDGDRRESTYSGDSKRNPFAFGPELDQKVVLELVQSDHVNGRMRSTRSLKPVEQIAQAAKMGNLVCESGATPSQGAHLL